MTDKKEQQPYTIAILAEAARQGGRPVASSTIARQCREGKIRAEKIGRAWMIAPRDAQLWLIEWLKL